MIQNKHEFIKTFNVPKYYDITSKFEKKINSNKHFNINNLNKIINDYNNKINYEIFYIKLIKNLQIDKETVILGHLFEDIIKNNCNKKQPINSLMTILYEIFSQIVSKYVLNQRWCSNCMYHNRICKIGGKYLKFNDYLMNNCMVCGIKK